MSQAFLDPSDESTNGIWNPPAALPPRIREFGRFPNVDSWRPGDLILLSALKPGRISRKIIATQRKGGFAEQDARWHHAAIYLGKSRICEAIPTGVKTSFIYRYVGSHLIRVRRGIALSPEDGWEIVLNVMYMRGWNYSWLTPIQMLFQSNRGFWNELVRLPFGSRRAVICSELFADAYSLATGIVLGNTAGATPTPAFLSNTQRLQDLGTFWRSIH